MVTCRYAQAPTRTPKAEEWFQSSPVRSLFALLAERYVTQPEAEAEAGLVPWLIAQLSGTPFQTAGLSGFHAFALSDCVRDRKLGD